METAVTMRNVHHRHLVEDLHAGVDNGELQELLCQVLHPEIYCTRIQRMQQPNLRHNAGGGMIRYPWSSMATGQRRSARFFPVLFGSESECPIVNYGGAQQAHTHVSQSCRAKIRRGNNRSEP